MPSARALRVISLANSSSSPATASAITTAASLAERVGITVDDDGGELRVVAFPHDVVVPTVLVAAGLGAFAADQDRSRKGNESEGAHSQHARGSQGCTKHLLPRPNFCLDHRRVRQNCAQPPLILPRSKYRSGHQARPGWPIRSLFWLRCCSQTAFKLPVG